VSWTVELRADLADLGRDELIVVHHGVLPNGR
jgi:hypothetical protein